MEHLEGDLEMLEAAYEIFCEESELSQAKLRAAFDAGDLDSVRANAHTLKGMLSNFMADLACQTTIQLETIEDVDALADSRSLLNILREQINEMLLEIKQILETGDN